MVKYLFMIALLAGCGHADDKPEPSSPMDASVTYGAAAARLGTMLEDGWVVSRGPGGDPRDQGDSLIFTGIAMGALSCADGAVPEAALVKMLREKNGGVYRHPSIPDDYSLDGLLGMWWGIAGRTKRCPETKELWASLLPQHEAAVAIEPFFHTALQQVMADLGVGTAPTASDRGELGSVVSGWAFGVVANREAAFRLHLGFLTLSMIDAPQSKNIFCASVPKANIALLEQFCDRAGLSAWSTAFAYNRYVYAFQRASWETETVPSGEETPGLDLLVALRMLYPGI